MSSALTLIISSERLPTLPEVGLRVVEIARQEDPDFVELARVIKADPAIASRILRVANSVAFGLRKQFTSIEAALPALGARMVRTLVLGFSLAGQKFQGVPANCLKRLWRKSLAQACAAEFLAQRAVPEKATDWFLAGMIQDIGQLAMLNEAPQRYQKLFETNGFLADPCCAERAEFDFDHAQLSAEMCRQWQFESELIDAIGDHHLPMETNPVKFGELADLPVALQIANAAATVLEQIAGGDQNEIEAFQDRLHATCAMAPEETVAMLEEISARVNEIADSFGMDVGQPPTSEEILAGAQRILVEIAVQSQLDELQAKKTAIDAVQELAKVKCESSEIRQKANRDALTGVYNRCYLEEVLAGELQECQSEQQAAGVIFLDIDHFKSINDTFGHQVGDLAIRLVAQILKQSTRATDLIVRYGGDEFVVVLPNVSEEVCRKVANRIHSEMTRARIEDQPEVKLTISLGAIFFAPQELVNVEVESFIVAADQAMYSVKTSGRNAVLFVVASESKLFESKA